MWIRPWLVLGAAAAAVGGLAVPAGASAGVSAESRTPVVVVSHLNNPRQLTFAPGGSLLIAEAGRGARHPDASRCSNGPEGQTCIGATGSITRIEHPWSASHVAPDRVVTGLLSGGAADGGQATGSDGVAYQNGAILVQMTYAPPAAIPAGLPAWQLGHLLRVVGSHKRLDGNISRIEFEQNPDGLQVDTNPYSVVTVDGTTSISADAAGNDLIRVHDGASRLLTVLPLHGCGGVRTQRCDRESVPTSLTKGPDGRIYVGELAHFEPQVARVWRVSPTSGALLGYYGRGGTLCPGTGGFTTITGVAFGPDGSLYVSELIGGPDGSGDVVKISRSCHRSSVAVPLPGGVVVGSRGNVYVSAFSISDADGAAGPDPSAPPLPPGQVWRLRF
ncbi:MAG: hypothetical protein DLM56_13920 [Pseudonocardiales bacterium]|nr:MAG: hypothetical protein DLM56_13920 [Pseudonocardiales bacterium]